MLGSGVGDGAVMVERENMESLRREAKTVVGARPGSGLGSVEREQREWNCEAERGSLKQLN